ncbi:MAG: 2Fe-2S iron-sulfur cluster-binding protein [Planctomycetaceae bacterium]|nr:2Fe-2S iron-sulfur cluster-binding protein [Planctomycetaceae bacterium]
MMELLVPVLIMGGIGAVLASVLVVAEKVIANYGICKLTINDKKELHVQGGKPLLTVLREQKIFIPSACGGRGTCGICKLKVLEGAGAILPTETPFMDQRELAENVRLSCQVKIRNDLRIVIPEELFSIQEFQTVCTRITDLTYDMKLFRFELRDPPEIDFTAGQFVQLLCPRYKGSPEEVYRAYSVASDPQQKNAIELIIRRVPHGICTTWCFDFLKQGDPVSLNGPYGQFCLGDTNAPAVFVAGGSGMAPFVCLLHHMRNKGIKRKAEYFFGGNTVKDQCLQAEMSRFEQQLEGFKFIPVVARPEPDSGWQGETGLVTDAVRRHYTDLAGHEGYLCGSPGMIDASIKVLVELGMKKTSIFYDKFS